jgi:hypothetical protein
VHVRRDTKSRRGVHMSRSSGFRLDVKTYSFVFVPGAYDPTADGVTLDEPPPTEAQSAAITT